MPGWKRRLVFISKANSMKQMEWYFKRWTRGLRRSAGEVPRRVSNGGRQADPQLAHEVSDRPHIGWYADWCFLGMHVVKQQGAGPACPCVDENRSRPGQGDEGSRTNCRDRSDWVKGPEIYRRKFLVAGAEPRWARRKCPLGESSGEGCHKFVSNLRSSREDQSAGWVHRLPYWPRSEKLGLRSLARRLSFPFGLYFVITCQN